ncbi:MAG: biotin--[acetyl-CoA-carboxylase] ligase, partial [Desulfuromonas sp.]
RWEALCNIMNQRVTVDQSLGSLLQGTVVGLDTDGALRVQTESGAVERVIAGDVRPVG